MPQMVVILLIGLLQASRFAAVPMDPLKAVDFICPGDGNFPIPGECSEQYYICIGGSPFIVSCPAGLIFDPVNLMCSQPDLVNCQTETTTEEPTTPEETTTPEPETTTTPKPETTTTTEPEITTTPEPEITTALEPETTITPEPETTKTSEATTSGTTTATPFTCPDVNGFFPNPNDCGSYYSCSNNIPILFDCPYGLVYNPNIKQCDYPANVPSCENYTPGVRPTTVPAAIFSANFNCPVSDGIFANPNNCNSYYTCHNRIPILKFCSLPLAFNEVAGRCEVAKNVPGCQQKYTFKKLHRN